MLLSLFTAASDGRGQISDGADLAAVDVSAYPWSSIAKLNNSVGGSCTASVVARDAILTAAHCLFNTRTRRFLPASSLHVLLGYEREQYAIHSLVSSYSIGPGYDPERKLATLSADWAILKLTEPLPSGIRALHFVERKPPQGTRLAVASYAKGRRYVLTVDDACNLLREVANKTLFESDCRAAEGSSGAPVLIIGPKSARVVGVQVAVRSNRGKQRTLAVWAQNIKDALAELKASSVSDHLSD